MPTTSNFGWTTPADTDLVKDGAAAIRTLGNGIDTSLLDLKGGTTGQILSKATNTDLDYTWITPNVGDITEVQAGTGISVASGTGPIPVVTNSMATAIDAKGDIVAGTGADAFSRLAVGANNTVLTADSTASTGLKWAAVDASSLTLLSTTTLSGTTNITSISGAYKNLVIYIQDPTADADFTMLLWSNQNTSTSQIHISNSQYGNAVSGTNNYYYIASSLENMNNYTGTTVAMRIENYASTTLSKAIISYGIYRNASNAIKAFRNGGAYNVPGTAITSLRFDTTGGSFTGGTVLIYGEK